MAHAAAVVRLEVVEIVYGVGWCRTCLLPSGIRCVVMTTSGCRSSLTVHYRCDDCGGHQIDPDPVS